ncbi:PGPGW domain-containing protein [Candidatus Spongiihabitans sp.]|uniref:PGPGW domain-containing protein n=1 Tax=Candidatus Spongiihabitans sp. TaxID=3101308 RepID=UPI003C6FB78D
MPSLPRQILGILLLLGGLFWFLPILGLWMIPLGLLILSIDFQWARRGYLSIISWLRKRRGHRKRKKAD